MLRGNSGEGWDRDKLVIENSIESRRLKEKQNRIPNSYI